VSPLELGDGGEDALAAPCSLQAPGAKPPEGRFVKVGIISMPVFGTETMKLSRGKGLAAIVPRDRRRRDSQLQA